MLRAISLKNFILIDQLELAFHDGMTVITGETGAGKSILLDAIEIALGAKASAQMVRAGEERAEINLIFDISQNESARQWLEQHDFDSEDECLIRRVLTSEGKNRCYIQNTPTSVQQVQELAEILIHIFGQHQHHYLLKNNCQRELLDRFAQTETLAEQVKKTVQQWQTIQNQLEQAHLLAKESTQRKEFLKFQLQDVLHLKIKINEWDELENQHKLMAQSEKLMSDCYAALETLQGESSQNLMKSFHLILKQLDPYTHLNSEIKAVFDSLQSAEIQVQDAADRLQDSMGKFEYSPEYFHQLEQRLSDIQDVARKYRVHPNELMSLQQQWQTELDQLENIEVQTDNFEKSLLEIEKNYQNLALDLSKKRKKSAKLLTQNVTEHLQHLGMAGSQFEVHLTTIDEAKPQIHGLEKIEFLVKTNAGMPMQALSKVASGGEISRISLAIETVLAGTIQTSMIFDEVDVGIGGKTAEIVGKLLRQLAHNHQVMAITHLPQVAAQGHHHVQVEKTNQAKTTRTQIHYLSAEQRIQELARMLGGIQITQQTLAHAQEMLVTAQEHS